MVAIAEGAIMLPWISIFPNKFFYPNISSGLWTMVQFTYVPLTLCRRQFTGKNFWTSLCCKRQDFTQRNIQVQCMRMSASNKFWHFSLILQAWHTFSATISGSVTPYMAAAPNWQCQNPFSPSILTQLKIPLEDMLIWSMWTFLQEEINSGFLLRVGKSLHKVSGT